LLHDPAPEFRARTTLGERSLSGYRGQWLLLFSHPADFTPVCTSEFVAFARNAQRFAALGCELLALSVDSLFSHLAWIRSIHEQFGVKIPFPIIEDPSMAIARAYGMIAPNGRNVEELVRVVCALQTTDAHHVSTPEGWRPGEDVILPAPLIADEVLGCHEQGTAWYYRSGPLPAAVGRRGQRRG
jgi:peroxiredoxin (alkyl hydroperoxide reductase subunit C)